MLLDIGAEVYKYDFEFELGGRKILVQHEPTNLEVIAESNKYHLIIYGHTHEPDKRIVGNRTLILNPGEACGWLRGLSNIEIMDTDTMVPEIISLKSDWWDLNLGRLLRFVDFRDTPITRELSMLFGFSQYSEIKKYPHIELPPKPGEDDWSELILGSFGKQ